MEKIRPRVLSGSGAMVTFFFSTTAGSVPVGTDGGGGIASLAARSASFSKVEGGRGQGTVNLATALYDLGAPG